MYYDWHDDIIDVWDDEKYETDRDDIAYSAATKIVDDNGRDYYTCDYDDAIAEEYSSIIGLWAIRSDSRLAWLLNEWYAQNGTSAEKSARDYVEGWGDTEFFFVTGTGYTITDDLFRDKDVFKNTVGSGIETGRFDAFVREQMEEEERPIREFTEAVGKLYGEDCPTGENYEDEIDQIVEEIDYDTATSVADCAASAYDCSNDIANLLGRYGDEASTYDSEPFEDLDQILDELESFIDELKEERLTSEQREIIEAYNDFVSQARNAFNTVY